MSKDERVVPDFSVPNPARIYDYLLGGMTISPPIGKRPRK
jgi:hypothetical protein